MESIVSLYRYYLMAARMRAHFRQALGSDPWLERMHKAPQFAGYLLTVDACAVYMTLWYGTLFVLIEGWQKLDLKDARIDFLLQSGNVELLKHYRNGTFHFHRGLVSPICRKIMTSEDQVEWTERVSDAFKEYFDDVTRTREFMQAAKKA